MNEDNPDQELKLDEDCQDPEKPVRVLDPGPGEARTHSLLAKCEPGEPEPEGRGPIRRAVRSGSMDDEHEDKDKNNQDPEKPVQVLDPGPGEARTHSLLAKCEPGEPEPGGGGPTRRAERSGSMGDEREDKDKDNQDPEKPVQVLDPGPGEARTHSPMAKCEPGEPEPEGGGPTRRAERSGSMDDEHEDKDKDNQDIANEPPPSITTRGRCASRLPRGSSTSAGRSTRGTRRGSGTLRTDEDRRTHRTGSTSRGTPGTSRGPRRPGMRTVGGTQRASLRSSMMGWLGRKDHECTAESRGQGRTTAGRVSVEDGPSRRLEQQRRLLEMEKTEEQDDKEKEGAIDGDVGNENLKMESVELKELDLDPGPAEHPRGGATDSLHPT